jgi:CHAT domain-containing protein
VVPAEVRDVFDSRLARSSSTYVVGDAHQVPWEIACPTGGTEADEFLVERVPLLRWARRQRPARRLRLDSAVYVLSAQPPSGAEREMDAIAAKLGPKAGGFRLVREWRALVDALLAGDFGLLHLACHNDDEYLGWDSVELEGGYFKTFDLSAVEERRSLLSSQPLVFFNACSTAGGRANARIAPWASAFLRAGAGAFIGSNWPVASESARRYAEAFYEEFAVKGQSLANASSAARERIKDGRDPTWLAYAVYGDVHAQAVRDEPS